MFDLKAAAAAVENHLPNLLAALPTIKEAVSVTEAAAIAGPAIVVDLLALRAAPSLAGIEKLARDVEALWPHLVEAMKAGTVAENESAPAS